MCLNMGDESILLIPIGNSPGHSYRIWKSIHMKFDQTIFVYTNATEQYAHSIVKVCLDSGILILNLGTSIANILPNPKSSDFSIVFGPGTQKMSLQIWNDCLNLNNTLPEIILTHRKLTQRKNILTEYLSSSKINREKWSIASVEIDEALSIYGISEIEFETYNLSYNPKHCNFTYTIQVPDNVTCLNSKRARDWSDAQIVRVNDLKNKFGNHAISFKRENFPSKPRYWQNISEIFRDNSIFGGFNS